MDKNAVIDDVLPVLPSTVFRSVGRKPDSAQKKP